MPTKKAVTPINDRYNTNTFQSVRGRTVCDGLTAADILINIIIIPILNDVNNVRGFMSVLPYMTFYGVITIYFIVQQYNDPNKITFL